MMMRKDRAVTNLEDILKIIEKCKVFHVAMIDDGKPYLIPLNFGYTYTDTMLTLYFHCAVKGRKTTALDKNASVAFEMDCGHQIVAAPLPCKYDYFYESIIGEGNAVKLEDTAEKIHAFKAIMKHQTGKDFAFDELMMRGVTVYKIDAQELCGKAYRP